MAADGKLYFASERGRVVVLRATGAFEPLAANGSVGPTHLLQAGSPAADYIPFDCPPGLECLVGSGRCALLYCVDGVCPVSLFGCGESGECRETPDVAYVADDARRD